MTERRIRRCLLGRKEAAARGIKTGTTLAYESVWIGEECAGETWVERAWLPDEAAARAWAAGGDSNPGSESGRSACERPGLG